uniref:Calcium voltage-gated channel auxiliary subunit beta 2 n=1 Tax=Molossus molossus TaxID=27622 RepID=A0A7J8JR17_MOLMO|nr:calcium voltage-gated channel auxiliary subunit beta 2 [Molossus molossus]
MVQSDMSKSPPTAAAAAVPEPPMELLEKAAPAGALGAAAQSYGKGARRKNRFKGSDGSTSSDTTSNSFVRQVRELLNPCFGEAYVNELSSLSGWFYKTSSLRLVQYYSVYFELK